MLILYYKHLQLYLFIYAVLVNTDIVKSVIHLSKCRYYRAYAMNSRINFIITSTDLLAISGKVS